MARLMARRRPGPGGSGSGREHGYVTSELLLGTALLLLPVAVIVLVLPTWAERRSMAHAIAHEATRAVVRAPDWPTGKRRAELIVQEMAANYKVDPEGVRVQWEPDAGEAPLTRGQQVRAVVTVQVPTFPIAGLAGVASWEMTVTHTEVVDRYGSL
jgi:hypothetical protein